MFTLKTDIDGLLLSPSEPRHADALFTLVEQNRAYLRQWLPWLDHNTSVADSAAFLSTCQQHQLTGDQLHTLIWFHGELVGTVGFNSISRVNHTGEIGYWLAAAHTGRGFMTAAVRALLKIGYDEHNLHRIVIRAAHGNLPSRAIPERLGFCHEGTAREAGCLYGDYHDLEIYSLLRHEWDATR